MPASSSVRGGSSLAVGVQRGRLVGLGATDSSSSRTAARDSASDRCVAGSGWLASIGAAPDRLLHALGAGQPRIVSVLDRLHLRLPEDQPGAPVREQPVVLANLRFLRREPEILVHEGVGRLSLSATAARTEVVAVRSVMSSVWSLTVVVEENSEMIEGTAAAAAAASPTGPRRRPRRLRPRPHRSARLRRRWSAAAES